MFLYYQSLSVFRRVYSSLRMCDAKGARDVGIQYFFSFLSPDWPIPALHVSLFYMGILQHWYASSRNRAVENYSSSGLAGGFRPTSKRQTIFRLRCADADPDARDVIARWKREIVARREVMKDRNSQSTDMFLNSLTTQPAGNDLFFVYTRKIFGFFFSGPPTLRYSCSVYSSF
jgi:hypothetical protein